MAGYVRTNEKCPVCGKAYGEWRAGRERVFLCQEHQTMPRRVYVDASGFGLKRRKLYKDRDGNVFTSREAAEQFLGAMRQAKSSRAGWDPSEWEPESLREYRFEAEWEKWIAASIPEWSPAYLRQVRHVGKAFLAPAWERIDMRDIRNGHLIDLKTRLLGDQYAPSYIKTVLGIACSFLSALRKRGDIKAMLDRPEVKIPRRDLPILDAGQQERIIRRTRQRYHLILRLQARIGARPCELCALRVRDFVGGYIVIQRTVDDFGNVRQGTKTGEAYRRPIPADLTEDLAKQMRDKTDEAFVFLNRGNRPFRPGSLSRAWAKAAREAGFPGVTLYVGTRHSLATMTFDREEAAAWRRTADTVGHASPRTTRRSYVPTIVRRLSVAEKAPLKTAN